MATNLGIAIGDPIDLGLRLFDRDETKFVQARLFDENEAELASSPINLTHLSGGLYIDDSVPMPNTRVVRVNYDVYDDAGYTQLSDRHFPEVEYFLLDNLSQNVENLLAEGPMADLFATITEDESLKAEIVDNIEETQVINILSGARNLIIDGRNDSGAAQLSFRVWAWEDDNGAVLADANINDLQDFAGMNVDPVNDGATFQLIRTGVVPGALDGLGCVAGEDVFMSETPGEFTKVAPDPSLGAIVRLGQAVPSNHTDTGPANDLFLNPEIIG